MTFFIHAIQVTGLAGLLIIGGAFSFTLGDLNPVDL